MADEPAEKPKPTIREYEAEGIRVRWEPRFCVHTGWCVRDLPNVFDRTRRPWIDPTQAAADAIAQVVQSCPSGALHFERLDGGPQEFVPDVTSVEPQPNGPLHVRGRITITGEDGTVLREDSRMALCRCGASKHKPFCDDTHSHIGFTTD